MKKELNNYIISSDKDIDYFDDIVNYINSNEKRIEQTNMTVEKFSLMESSRIDGKLVYTEIGSIEAGEV